MNHRTLIIAEEIQYSLDFLYNPIGIITVGGVQYDDYTIEDIHGYETIVRKVILQK